MNTPPNLCLRCGKPGHTNGLSWICTSCMDALRAEAMQQFKPTPEQEQQLARDMRNAWPQLPDEAAEDRRSLIEEAWHPPNPFLDGFMLGGATAILLGILADWLFHLHNH